jgi:hypothetical protein
MTTRRTVLRLTGALPAAALLGACTPRPSASPPPAVARIQDQLAVETSSGLAIVDTSRSRVLVGPKRGVMSYDGANLATADVAGGRTRVKVRGIEDRTWFDVDLAGDLTPRVVAPRGASVALVADAPSTAASGEEAVYRPAGRRRTTIVVADASGETRRVTLPGCVEPEAFSTFGDKLYVLDYLPPTAPDRYRVRILDLASGAFTALLTRDKKVVPPGAEEEMRGQGRQAVYATGRTMLFTLYTHQPDHEHTRDLIAARAGRPDVHAFVHSLNVDFGYAYCVDLPAPFGEGPVEGHAIALSPIDDHPVVVDGASGTVARIDGAELTVRSTGQFPAIRGGGPVSALLAEGGSRLVIAADSAVRVLRTDSLSTVAQWPLAAPARGMALTRDGRRLWLGRPGGVVALDLASGRELASVEVPGLTGVVAAT